MVFLAGFIYFLPVWVLGIIFLVPTFIAAGANSDALGAMAGGGLCLFWLIAIVYSIAVAILFYAAMVNYAMNGDFGAFFRFGEIIERVRTQPGYWTAFLYRDRGLASLLAWSAGIIPVIGWLVSFAAHVPRVHDRRPRVRPVGSSRLRPVRTRCAGSRLRPAASAGIHPARTRGACTRPCTRPCRLPHRRRTYPPQHQVSGRRRPTHPRRRHPLPSRRPR